jgi:hypothetical protein
VSAFSPDAEKMVGLGRRDSWGSRRRFPPCGISPSTRPDWLWANGWARMHGAMECPGPALWLSAYFGFTIWNEMRPRRKTGRLNFPSRRDDRTNYVRGAVNGSLYLFLSALVFQLISHLRGIINPDDDDRASSGELRTTCDLEQLHFLRTIHNIP